MAWRAAILGANLQQEGHGYPVRGSDEFRRLDGTEKGAVTFFLGQVSTKLFAEHLLGIPCLARVDGAMRQAGIAVRGSRPDFYGYFPGAGVVAIESKGRTHGFDEALIRKAKKQAEMLTPVIAGGSDTAYAHVAYFDADGIWKAVLDDPPAVGDDEAPDAGAVLAAYYAPLVSALAERGPGYATVDDVEYLLAEFPEVDLRIGLRRDLAEATVKATKILPSLLAKTQPTVDGVPAPPELYSVEHLRVEAERATENRRSIGRDGVLVLTGNAWAEELMVLAPEARHRMLKDR